MKYLVALMLLCSSAAWAAVGSITDQQGPAASIKRSNQQIEANRGTGIQMNDAVSTLKTKIGITFEDKTTVRITEQSRLVVDDFVYDPKKGTGKLAMNVALGTVRYASGATGKNSRENVKINTPTATISVRGTDFTMTVDEVGKSLVILLPTCPDPAKPDECWTGAIEVATDVGYVLLNQAFQATMVDSRSSMPSEPKLISISEALIDNWLIVSPPNEFRKNESANNLGKENFLDQDLLEYNELTKNLLEEDQLKFSELDLNRLNIDYLDNILDITGRGLDTDEFEVDPVLPTIKRYSWIQWAYNEEIIFIRTERPPHIAEIITARDTNGVANIIQDGISAEIVYNGGGTDVVFNIIQTQ
jgi:hypothetical protein